MQHSPQAGHETHSKSPFWSLALGALGVVFGDIGTSPLYALKECFNHYALTLTEANLFGILSLIFWTLIIVICIKYMSFVMRADNKGEGGILALMALTLQGLKNESSRKRWFFTLIGIFGAALLYGDGIITPAISVLSAVEGLTMVNPGFEKYIVPVAIFVLSLLFFVQKVGTAKIGSFFGPVLLLWFTALAAVGIYGICQNPHVLVALSPHYAVQFFITNGHAGFLVLGSVFLVVTGGEALYADMGHFGRQPIRAAWFFVVLPALVINYFGQGAYLLDHPEAVANPFYSVVPKFALIPMLILATLSAVIASQALISGVYSITRQAIQLGFSPRLAIKHTSSREIGQIYVSSVNWALYAGVIWLVLAFQSSSKLAAAYGIAVTATMVITTILAFEVATHNWKWSVGRALPIFGLFLMIDLGFFSASALKLLEGGWVPVLIGLIIYVLMTTWKTGRTNLYLHLKNNSMSITSFCNLLREDKPTYVRGTAIYMSGDPTGVPLPLLLNYRLNHVIHERVALLTIQTKDIPYVHHQERVNIEVLKEGFFLIRVFYGFMETPKMKHILQSCREQNIDFDLKQTTFVIGRETIIARPGVNLPGTLSMSHWRERIFVAMSKNAQRPTAFFRIPPKNVIEIGVQVEL